MFLERDGVVNTSVASFRSALESLGLGEITLREVAEKVNQILVEAIDSADALLQAIDDAHAARIIADNDVSELRALIHNTISEAPSDSHASIDLTVADPDYADTPLLTESDPVDISPDGPVKLEVGAVLRGRFQLEAVLGGGGMGKVYRGVDLIKKEARDRNPYVAVKVLNEKFSVRADAFIALQREASRQQRLAHPNIAIVYDFDRAGSVMYMTMELLEGRPLDMYFKEDVIPRGGLPLDEAMGLIEGMAAALGYAHKQGMIHGDFKPGNCFVSDEGHLKVLDFGIARVIQTPGQSDTLDTLFDGSHLGAMTPAYASPEMLEGSAGADPRDDIYGLACVVYQLLGGVHPMAQLPADKAKALAYEPKPIEHLTRRQNDALRRGLAFERESRIASAEEFVESLRDDRPKHAFNQKHLTVAMALVVLIAASFAVPKFLEDRRFGEISEKVASREPPQVVDALENIGNQPIERRGRFLSVLGPEIIDFYREHFDRTMQMPDKALPFESLEIMFDAAIPLFPDSATLLGMREQLVERKHDYIAALSSQFESMVADEIVRSREEVDGLNLVLEQLRRIEPDSVLLDDERLTTSLANGAKTALIDGDLTAAKNLLAQAQRVATNDTILRDIADQIERAAQEQKRLARVEDLAALLVNSIGGLLALTDLASLQSTFSELEQLAPEHEILESIGHQLRERFPDSIKTIDAIPSLPALAPWSKILGVLALLGLEDVADAVQTRKTVLTTRSEVLAQRIRDMIHAPSANDKRVQELKGALAELAAIGSEVDADLRLPLEAVDAYRERARELQQDNEWDAARTHLQAARAFAVALRAADLEKDLAGVDAAEVRAGELARLKSEQAAKAEKDALIEATTRELNALLSNLTINGENLGNARHLIETLNELLDRDATIVPEANRTITQTVVRGVERAITARQFDSAEDTLNTARNHGFFTDELAELEQTIEQGRRVAKAIAQTEALESAIRSIDTLLAESTRLTQRERQRQIAGAFKALTTLGSDDSTLTKTQQRVAAAYLSLADELANQDRFTLARQLLDEANAYDAGKAEIDALRARIDAAETNYKTKRAEAELAARRSAVRSQFENFLKAGEPGMAERALGSLRRLPAADETKVFIVEQAPQQLAHAYAEKAAKHLAVRDYQKANASLERARALGFEKDGVEEMQRAIDSGNLSTRLEEGFKSGRVFANLSGTQEDIARLRALGKGAFEELRTKWLEMSLADLAKLSSQPDAYNQRLFALKELFPDAGELSGFNALPTQVPRRSAGETASSEPTESETQSTPRATPAVTNAHATPAKQRVDKPTSRSVQLDEQLLRGTWCGPNMNIEFKASEMIFHLKDAEIQYAVSEYEVAGDRIAVYWRDKGARLVTEFGEFSDDGGAMTQLRGRVADEGAGDWRTYDRKFMRCR